VQTHVGIGQAGLAAALLELEVVGERADFFFDALRDSMA
jgi:hypothetical protein